MSFKHGKYNVFLCVNLGACSVDNTGMCEAVDPDSLDESPFSAEAERVRPESHTAEQYLLFGCLFVDYYLVA